MILGVTVVGNLDMTIPIWGILGLVAICIVFIVKRHIQIQLMEKDMKSQNKELGEIKQLLYAFIKPENRRQ